MAISKRLRFEILRRDGNTCRYCGSGGTVDNPLVVDHVMPSALGGADHPSNLVASCTACNAGKTSSLTAHVTVADVPDTALNTALKMCGLAWRRVRELESAALERADDDDPLGFDAGRDDFALTILDSFTELERAASIAHATAQPPHDWNSEVVLASLHAFKRLQFEAAIMSIGLDLLLHALPTDVLEECDAKAIAELEDRFGPGNYGDAQIQVRRAWWAANAFQIRCEAQPIPEPAAV